MKEALLKKETVRLSVLRSLLAGFTNELVARGRKPQEEATDEEALSVIKRSVKQHKDSIEQFKAGGREDLVVDETAELMILETYLPMSMPKEEIKKVAEEVKTRLGVTDKAKMGQLVGAVMKELKGKANGGDVKAVVESLFS